MKYAKILLALWLASSTEIVAASSFMDSLRNFIAGREAQAYPAPENLVDKAAGECLECHNGSMTHNVNVRTAGAKAPIHDFRANDDHPVGLVYQDSVRRDPRNYRPAIALHPNIRLVDGRVTCITCHKVKNETMAFNEARSSDQPVEPQCTATKEITMGNSRDDKLCLACHVK
jgi:hypothetical protein